MEEEEPLDPTSPEAIARRVAMLGGEEDDEGERLAREEEAKLAERRRGQKKKGKKKGGLRSGGFQSASPSSAPKLP